MTEKTLDIDKLVDRNRLDSIYKTTWANVLATLVVMGVFVGVMATNMPWEPLLAWYGVLVAVMLVRILNYLDYRKQGGTHVADTRSWWLRYRLTILATALALGSSILLTFPHVPVAYQIFNAFVLAGISSGALTVMILDHLAYLIYLVLIMLPTSLVFARYGDGLHLAISLMTLVFIVLLIRASSILHRKVIDALTLGFEKRQLAERLREEKEQLDNRLGRILNDSSNEIFILDAKTLQCMQVNQGALQHLGYDEAEITRLNLLDIVCDLTPDDFFRLIAPLLQETEESVFYHGYHRRRDGSRYPVEVRLQYSSSENPPVIVATALDMSERDKVKRQLIHQANFDQLTDLPNRFSMRSRIEQAFFQARRNHTMVALLFLDLDNFKKVNDALGHAAGDILLQEAADRIRAVIRDSDTPSRLGGDEFMIMLEGLSRARQARLVADKLVTAFKAPFHIGGSEIYTSVSIGISLFPEDGISVEELMQFADIAMYHAKQEGGSRHRCFDQDMFEALEEKLALEGSLRRAIGNGELSLHYQPKVDAVGGHILGAEALLRWSNPQFGQVPPDRFIPLAENLGLIGEIGDWVLREACREAAGWPEVAGRSLRVAVNVSPHQFHSGMLLEDVAQALSDSGLPPERLELEITENLLLQDSSHPLETLERLRERGVHLSLDDFGTGYSSLSYLKRFPLQVLKIDRCFIRDMISDDNARALVKAIISMAHSLGLDVVAEGVEDRGQLDFLHRHGVRVIQGYYFSPPVDAGSFRRLLEKCALHRPHFERLTQQPARCSRSAG